MRLEAAQHAKDALFVAVLSFGEAGRSEFFSACTGLTATRRGPKVTVSVVRADHKQLIILRPVTLVSAQLLAE